MHLPPRTMQVVCESAVDATGAALGWIGVLEGDHVVIVAAAGEEAGAAARLVGQRVPTDRGSVGFVLQSGQPMAVQPVATSSRSAGGDDAATLLLGRMPTSVLCVPCASAADALGVLEVFDKYGGGPFSFDDVEIVTLLGAVAGAALADAGAAPVDAPSPSTLSSALNGLAETDPERYAHVATIVDALLRNG